MNTRFVVIDCRARPMSMRVFEGRTFLHEFHATVPDAVAPADIEYVRTYVAPAVPA